jgi:hypothetical protein
MFLNSTRNGLIWIEDLDQEIEGEEPNKVESAKVILAPKGVVL